MSVYLQRLNDNLAKNLERLRDYTAQGLEKFTEHPIKYSADSIKDLVKDYWDLAAAVVAGLTLADVGGQIFGHNRPVILTISGAASAIGAVSKEDYSNPNRLFRNAMAIMAVATYFKDGTLSDKFMAGIYGASSLSMEGARKKRNNLQETPPLETIVVHSEI